MNNALYIFGCSCGPQSRPVKQVQSKINLTVYNTKRDSKRLQEHIKYLVQAGIEIKHYPTIVVENQGERISLIDQWIQQH